MASYSYLAVNPKGKELKGTVEADSPERAAELLKKDGLTVASVVMTGALGRDISLSFLDKKPKPRDMAVFCRQFVSIVNAGVAVIKALEMLGEQTENKRLRAAILDCKAGIEKGESLASSMRLHRDIFPDIFITMAEAGEASGSLEVSFTRMAEQFEKDSALRAVVKKASTYPVVVIVVAIGVVIAMLTFVIPNFESMFEDLGTQLPGITLAVMALSHFLVTRWYLVAGIVAGLVAGIKSFKASDSGKRFFSGLHIKLPVINRLIIKTASARMARTLSTLLAAGIPMIEALDITSRTMTNVYFKEAIEQAKDDVAMGNPLSETLQRSGVFPPLVYHMAGIGEDTGDVEGMMTKMADYYEEEVQQATQQVMALLEPLIIVLLALIVGTIIIAVISPMMTMYSALDSI
ncbi:MAG: type II secretion system F family protein [Oscillospiraceae bacterium]|nr:type II secretion system F family protein [Oscillospiraceae bacterium]